VPLLLLALLAPLACGDDDDGGSGDTVATSDGSAAKAEREEASRVRSRITTKDAVKALPPSIVKDGDIRSQPEGSPGRAFLEWWQAFQYHDVTAALDLTSRATIAELRRRGVAKLVRLTALQGVTVLGVSEDGSAAQIRGALLTFQPEKGKPPPTKPTGSQPVTFAMRREGGRWRFAETPYLALKLEALNR
jgi:hypothetical protein